MDEKIQRSHVHLSQSKRKAQTAGRLVEADDAMCILELDPDLQNGLAGFPRHPLFPTSLPWGSHGWGRRLSFISWIQILLYISTALVGIATAASVTFENCMSPNIIGSDPRQLQFRPLLVRATFNATAPSHNLNVTVYGNVSGSATDEPLPALGDPRWNNTKETLGKIPELDLSNNKYTTLKVAFKVLDYTPYTADPEPFCSKLIHGQCPLGPTFYANGSNPAELPAFSAARSLYSSYAFTTITAILEVVSGDINKTPLACISANITPDLGRTVGNILIYVPLVVLLLVAIATACAAIFSPWGSTDIFRWTTNYGRDADLLRLVTPGFGDCLQYVQFVVLGGSLSLRYPGFYQPVVSKVSWSALMFNESFVSHGSGAQSLSDGVYTFKPNGTYGLDRMSQLVGMTEDVDIWAGMAIWLLAINVAFVVLIQIGFLGRWAYRHISNTQQEDFRAKNIPFTIGNSVRIVFNYFLLPIVAFSTYQLVIARHSSSAAVGLAAVLLFACVGFAVWLLWLIASTRPRSYLFDDLPTVLLYGPLYNTYSDNAATFALVPVMLTFARGIAIGGMQASGIAQVVLLAICEVILILTLNAFRPFHSPTSMNAFHTVFSVVRLLTVLLSVAFVPSLDVTESARGWLGYVILLMHAIVLIFGFFLNAFQTLIEVIARLAGAGGEEGVGGGAARGGLVKVFGMRQLSRRNPRRRGQARHSMASDAHILGHDSDQKSVQLNGGRSRSMSGSSTILLNRQHNRASSGLDSVSATGAHQTNGDSGSAPYTPTTSGGASAFSYMPGTSQVAGQGNLGGPRTVGLTKPETSDPWYRPPRARRPTNDAPPSQNRHRGSWISASRTNKRWSLQNPEPDWSLAPLDFPAEGPSASERTTPHPLQMGFIRDRSDSNLEDPRRSKTDYATREVDYYYGVRGPALSTLPTRRLKTGPADPTGPVSSATGWFKNLFGGKTKEKGKGFEVVRSSRAPPVDRRAQSAGIGGGSGGPYFDDPQLERTRNLQLSDDGDAIGGGTRHLPDEAPPSPLGSELEGSDKSLPNEDDSPIKRTSQIPRFPPSLPTIETGNGIELPSRLGSKASSRHGRGNSWTTNPDPSSIKATRRASQPERVHQDGFLLLPRIDSSPPSRSQRLSGHNNSNNILPERLQPSDNVPQRLPFESRLSSSQETRASTSLKSAGSSISPSASNAGQSDSRPRAPSSALGALAPDLRYDRPSSMGYVHQHRAGDNIRVAQLNDSPLLGSTAELHDGSSRKNTGLDERLAPSA